jgi:exonuclease III
MDQDVFPLAEIEAAGYRAAWFGQKTYNGVAILVRAPLQLDDVVLGIPGYDDPQRRVIAATVNGVRVICGYFVNGEAVDSPKYPYKLEWLGKLHDYVADELTRHPQLALLGDYNIAPEDRDVYDPESWHEQVLCSTPERAAFRGLIDPGTGRQLPPVQSGGQAVQLVGLPRHDVPPQQGRAYRPHPDYPDPAGAGGGVRHRQDTTQMGTPVRPYAGGAHSGRLSCCNPQQRPVKGRFALADNTLGNRAKLGLAQ